MPIINEIVSNTINLHSIYDKYPDEQFVSADGFDDAILGVDDDKMIIVYSTKKVLNILMEVDEMSYEDALEHFYFFDYPLILNLRSSISSLFFLQ